MSELFIVNDVCLLSVFIDGDKSPIISSPTII